MIQRGQEALEHFLPKSGIDIDGSGVKDFLIPRSPVIYYFKCLLPCLMVNLVLQANLRVLMNTDFKPF